jgi:hypothetical protein
MEIYNRLWNYDGIEDRIEVSSLKMPIFSDIFRKHIEYDKLSMIEKERIHRKFYNLCIRDNISINHPDLINMGGGKFILYSHNPLGSCLNPKFIYNPMKVNLDLSPIYKIHHTPYYNCGSGDFKYTLSDFDWLLIATDQFRSKPTYKGPTGRYFASNITLNDVKYHLEIGPLVTNKIIHETKLGTEVEWNSGYIHPYIGPREKLEEGQIYGMYYARDVYWYEDEKEEEITKLLTLCQKYHGKKLGTLSDIGDNQLLNNSLLSLLNYFLPKDRILDTIPFIIDSDITKPKNLYGSTIICDEKTRGLVIDVPYDRKGVVGKFFMPFIKPDANSRYTESPDRCNFNTMLWYNVPWEKGNCINYLMLTDSEVCEEDGNKVKAYIATRRGHTKHDMPLLSDDDIKKMPSYFGFGYHYRLNANHLFKESIILTVPDIATFDSREDNLFRTIYEQTGVYFPIDNNAITCLPESYGLHATIKFTGAHARVFFMDVPVEVKIIPDEVSFFSQQEEKVELSLVTDGYYRLTSIDNKDALVNKPTCVDLSILTQSFNLSKDILDNDLTMLYPILREIQLGETMKMPAVQIEYLTTLFKRYIGYTYFVNREPDLAVDRDILVNIGNCDILYNGPNTKEEAKVYYDPDRKKYLMVIRPLHETYGSALLNNLTLSYEI